MTVGWLNPALESANTGDQIIADAVNEVLIHCTSEELVQLPTRRQWTTTERAAARACRLFIVGGTNLLTSHPLSYRQWTFGWRDALILRHRVILLGVGWWQYQGAPDALATLMLSWLLHPTALHGVRDSYAEGKLSELGHNVANVSCPTLWLVPRNGHVTGGFRRTVVSTVTDYNRDPDLDRLMLSTLKDRSERLLIWPQGSDDEAYITELGFGQQLLPAGLEAFHRALDRCGAEYVGTRLHAGIRALNRGKPAVVIGVDNRAIELGSDVGLWVVKRSQLGQLEYHLDRFLAWRLFIPDHAIERWRKGLGTL